MEETAKHPNHPGRVFHRDGSITLANGKNTRGGVTSDGYRIVYMSDKDKKFAKRYVHRLILEAFTGEVAGEREVDHINRNPSDNRVENLRFLTKKANRQHMHAGNPNISKNTALKRAKVVIGTSPAGQEYRFMTMTRATAFMKLPLKQSGIITKVIKSGGTVRKWKFRYANTDAVGEVWKKVDNYPGLETDIWASNFGRIKKPKRTTHGSNGQYFKTEVNINGKLTAKGVHHFVCWAFHGPQPAGSTSVNHIDRNTQNNRPENLEWSNAQAQAAHKMATTKCRDIGPMAIEIIQENNENNIIDAYGLVYDNLVQCADKTEKGDVYNAPPSEQAKPIYPRPSIQNVAKSSEHKASIAHGIAAAKRKKTGLTDDVIEQVRVLIAQEKSNKNICDELKLSSHVVSNIKLRKTLKLSEMQGKEFEQERLVEEQTVKIVDGKVPRRRKLPIEKILEILKYAKDHPIGIVELKEKSEGLFNVPITVDIAKSVLKATTTLSEKEFPVANTSYDEYVAMRDAVKNRNYRALAMKYRPPFAPVEP